MKLICYLIASLSLAISSSEYLLVSPIHPLPDDSMSFFTHIINKNGSIIHSLSHEHYAASTPYLIDEGIVVRPCRITNTEIGGAGGRIEKIKLDGETIWKYDLNSNLGIQHHDIEPMDNGNILCLAWEYKTQEDALNKGMINHTGPLWSDIIVELKPIGYDSADIVWEWRAWDHIIQDIYPDLNNYVENINDHPHKLNVNFGYSGGDGPGPPQENSDFLHINSISYNKILDQIVFSSRKTNEIYIIDHSTTTEQASTGFDGYYNHGGDFLYRWGNRKLYTNSNDQKLYAPHSANWIDYGYPGSGNIIIFNNGVQRPGNDYSSVEEISPPLDNNGNYIFTESEALQEPVWTYDGNQDYFTSYQGGAYRLENGNTLVTITDSKDIIEVNNNGTIVWSYNWQNEGYIARAQLYKEEDIPIYILGDINDDGIIDILDIIQMINIITSESSQDDQTADLNNDGIINILDIVLLINIIIE